MFARTRIGCVAVLALIVGVVSATKASAGWIGFRNDLSYPVIVQSAAKINGAVRRGTPHYLHAGEVSYDWAADNSVKQITIYDGRSPRTVLDRFDASVGKADLFYVIQAGRQEQTVQTTLVSGTKPTVKPKLMHDEAKPK